MRTDGFLGRRTKKDDFNGKSHRRRKQSSENIPQDKHTQRFSLQNKDSQIASAERHRPLIKGNAAETNCWLAEDRRSDAEARGVSGVPGQANHVGATAVRVGVRLAKAHNTCQDDEHIKTRSPVMRTSHLSSWAGDPLTQRPGARSRPSSHTWVTYGPALALQTGGAPAKPVSLGGSDTGQNSERGLGVRTALRKAADCAGGGCVCPASLGFLHLSKICQDLRTRAKQVQTLPLWSLWINWIVTHRKVTNITTVTR